MALTQELEVYFDNLDEMFGTMGWRSIVDNAKEEIEMMKNNALEASSYEEVMFIRGKVDVLRRLMNMRDLADATRAVHEQDDGPDDADI